MRIMHLQKRFNIVLIGFVGDRRSKSGTGLDNDIRPKLGELLDHLWREANAGLSLNQLSRRDQFHGNFNVPTSPEC